MPRKQTSRATQLKPTPSTHPALQSTLVNSLQPNQARAADVTVNDLLCTLRSSSGRRNNPPSSTHAPPSSLLHPTTPPARTTRRALSPRSKMAERRRARGPPGPPAPPSWARLYNRGIHASIHAPSRTPRSASVRSGASVLPLPGTRVPPAGSLKRIVLERIAANWTWHSAEELDWIGVLPSSLRESLLWTLANQGVMLSRMELHALIVGTKADDGLENESPERKGAQDSWEAQAEEPDTVLSLTIGPSIASPKAYTWLKDIVAPRNEGRPSSSGKRNSSLLDSASEAFEERAERPQAPLRIVEINLSRLSLTGATDPSWTRLLALVPFLPHITHLDLSMWPMPESIDSVAERNVNSSGPLGYSSLPALEQSALTLRRLGRGLNGLQWLGLDGCAGWMGVWTAGDERGEDVSAAKRESVDFARSFPRLHTLRLSPAISSPALAEILAHESAFEAAVTAHTNDPLTPFPCPSPFDLLRVPEPGVGDRDYEGPRWVRNETVQHGRPVIAGSSLSLLASSQAAPTRITTYTLQHAQRLPLWRQLVGYLDTLLDIRDLEVQLRRRRRDGLLHIVRTGIDDTTAPTDEWRRALLERWARYEKEGRHRDRIAQWEPPQSAFTSLALDAGVLGTPVAAAAEYGNEAGSDAWDREFR